MFDAEMFWDFGFWLPFWHPQNFSGALQAWTAFWVRPFNLAFRSWLVVVNYGRTVCMRALLMDVCTTESCFYLGWTVHFVCQHIGCAHFVCQVRFVCHHIFDYVHFVCQHISWVHLVCQYIGRVVLLNKKFGSNHPRKPKGRSVSKGAVFGKKYRTPNEARPRAGRPETDREP